MAGDVVMPNGIYITSNNFVLRNLESARVIKIDEMDFSGNIKIQIAIKSGYLTHPGYSGKIRKGHTCCIEVFARSFTIINEEIDYEVY